MFEMKGFDDEIGILWYQSGAEKKNKTIKNIIWLILCRILIKNDQKGQKMPKNAKKHQNRQILPLHWKPYWSPRWQAMAGPLPFETALFNGAGLQMGQV